MRQFRFAVVCLLVGSLACIGCGDDSADEPAAEGEAEQQEISATLGPEGGTLTGEGMLGFEGFRLVIPAGALKSSTTITVRPGLDALPLGNETTFCGPGFTIEGDNGALEGEMSLTLPVTQDIVTQMGQTSGDVKVWVLRGGAWVSAEATGSADGEVTIALDTFTTTAAGINLRRSNLLCNILSSLGTCTSPMEIALAAPSCPAGQLCITTLGVPEVRPLGGLAPLYLKNGKLYYVGSKPVGTAFVRVIAEMDLTTRAIRTSADIPTLTGTPRNLAVDAFNNGWVGLDGGHNVKALIGGNAISTFDIDAQGFGAVALNNDLVRLSSLGVSVQSGTNTSFTNRGPIQGVNGVSNSRAVLNPNNGNFLQAYNSQTIGEFNFDGTAVRLLNNRDRVMPAGNVILQFGAVAIEDTVGPTAAVINSVGGLVVFPQGGTPEALQGLPRLADVAFDNQGRLWVAMLETPEIGLITSVTDPGNRSITLIPLNGADAAGSRLPQRLAFNSADGKMIVRTSGQEFLVLEASMGFPP